MTIRAQFPAIRPSLDLNFARTRALDPRVTFSRASTGTFVGSNGLIQTAASGAARFDHNPTTGESLGLLVEESKTNYALYSDGLNSSVWWNYVYQLSRTSNAGTSPDGTTTASLFTVNTGTQQHFLAGNRPSVPSSIYTFSLYAKQGTGSYRLGIRVGDDANDPYVYFNFSTGQAYNTNATTKVENLPGGWYRISITTNTAVAMVSPYIFMLDESGTDYYTGNGTSSFYVWGAQAEAGSFATSYIPTTTATVTRAADVASMTGTNFSSWYRQDEGTLLASAISFGPSAANFVADIDEGAVVNEIGLAVSSTFFWGLVYNSGSYQADLRYGTPVANSKFLASLAYKANNFQLSANGVAYSPDTSGSVPAMARMTIGSRTNTANWLNGTIARFAYYPVRLPDAQLQALTK